MYCLQCGEANSDSARFCSQCGTKVAEQKVMEYALENSNTSHTKTFKPAEDIELIEEFEPAEEVEFAKKIESAVKKAIDRDQPQTAPPQNPHKPLLRIKPRMVTWVILARYIPLQINLTFIGAFIFGSLAVMYHFFTGTLDHPFRPFIFFAVFFFVLVPIIVYIAYRRTMDETYYEFYPDRLEYYEGFWTAHHKVLYYRHITDITLRRNLIQRLYGMGTIHFDVPNRGPKYRGLFVSDIEHPVTMLDEVENIVRAY